MEHETLDIVKNIGRPAAPLTAKGEKQSKRLAANGLNDCLRNYTREGLFICLFFKRLTDGNDKIDDSYFNL